MVMKVAMAVIKFMVVFWRVRSATSQREAKEVGKWRKRIKENINIMPIKPEMAKMILL